MVDDKAWMDRVGRLWLLVAACASAGGACVAQVDDEPIGRAEDGIKWGTLSSDKAVGMLSGFGDCTGTTICARQKSIVQADGTTTLKNFAAVLSAAHCTTMTTYALKPIPQTLTVESQKTIALANFTTDSFRILRVVSAPVAALDKLPVRPIANEGGALPSDRTVIGYGTWHNDIDWGDQRSGVETTEAMDDGGDTFLSVAGPTLQVTCEGDSGGPQLLGGLITGTLYGGGYTDESKLCLSSVSSIHMNATKYRSAIEAAALDLVPECKEPDPPGCGFQYIPGNNPPAACAMPATMGNWRYASKGFPYVTSLTFPMYCRGDIDPSGDVPATPPANRSYVGVTWAQPSGTLTPAMCGCRSCGYVKADVTAAGLAYAPGQACNPGCGLPVAADLPYMSVQVTNRVNKPGQMMMPPAGTPLHDADLDPSKRAQVTVSCLPKDANCLVADRP